MSEDKPYNRIDNRLIRILTGNEYKLLDWILYRKELQDTGYKFRIRTLAKETNISVGLVSQIVSKWYPFITKSGTTKDMLIIFNYEQYLKWIVHIMNNDCSDYERIKDTYKVHVPCTLSKDTDKDNELIVSGSCSLPSTLKVPPFGESNTPIVHNMNNPPKYTISKKSFIKCPLSNGIKNVPSDVRLRDIINTLSKEGAKLKATTGDKKRDGYRVEAVDDTNKAILLTYDYANSIDNKHNQSLIEHFNNKGYTVWLFVGSEQITYRIIKTTQ